MLLLLKALWMLSLCYMYIFLLQPRTRVQLHFSSPDSDSDGSLVFPARGPARRRTHEETDPARRRPAPAAPRVVAAAVGAAPAPRPASPPLPVTVSIHHFTQKLLNQSTVIMYSLARRILY